MYVVYDSAQVLLSYIVRYKAPSAVAVGAAAGAAAVSAVPSFAWTHHVRVVAAAVITVALVCFAVFHWC
jgi:hypothetical protein